jgi:hypothetical protein
MLKKLKYEILFDVIKNFLITSLKCLNKISFGLKNS